MLGGLAVFRNQHSRSNLVAPSADILIVNERWILFLEAVSVPSSVIDELLREENVSWFGEGLDPRGDGHDVGNLDAHGWLEGNAV